MLVEFKSKKLERLYTDPEYTGGFEISIVRAFRKRMQAIIAATNERDLYPLSALRFEKLKGQMSHLRSIRLNDQFRLIVEMKTGSSGNTMVIVDIADYH